MCVMEGFARQPLHTQPFMCCVCMSLSPPAHLSKPSMSVLMLLMLRPTMS